jgi:tetratricopeptide (TPR) repeat protein
LEYGDYDPFYAGRANAYARAKDHDRALADLTKALELAPQAPSVLADRAGVFARMDRLEEAVRDLELASKLDPGESNVAKVRDWLSGALTHRGYELQKSGRYDDAIAEFSTAVRINPAGHEAYYWRARAHAQKGKFDLAESDLTQAVRLNQRYFEAYQTLDWVLARDRRWDEVVAHWNTFIQLEPKNANAYLERAGAFRRKGDMASAVADLKKSCDLGNGNACQIVERQGGRGGVK